MIVLIIAASAGLCVAAVVGLVATMVRGDEDSVAEVRLSTLTAMGRGDLVGKGGDVLLLRNSAEGTMNFLEDWMARKFNMKVALEQADIQLPLGKFGLMCVGLAGTGAAACLFAPMPYLTAPLVGGALFFLPV